jgi:hypothetical protein
MGWPLHIDRRSFFLRSALLYSFNKASRAMAQEINLQLPGVDRPLRKLDLKAKIEKPTIDPTRDTVTISNPAFTNEIVRYSEEVRADLMVKAKESFGSSAQVVIGPGDISIDDKGNVVISNKRFSSLLEFWQSHDAMSEDSNWCCHCNGYTCGK